MRRSDSLFHPCRIQARHQFPEQKRKFISQALSQGPSLARRQPSPPATEVPPHCIPSGKVMSQSQCCYWKNGNRCWMAKETLDPNNSVLKSNKYNQHLKIELPLLYNPTIPLLYKRKQKYTKEWEAGSQRSICTPMFIAPLFTKRKSWSKLNVHSWINESLNVYTYCEILFSIKNKGNT